MSDRAKVGLLLGLAVAATLVGLAAGALLAAGGGDGERRYRGGTPPPGVMLEDFALRDYTGEWVARDDLRGKVVLLTFLESNCKEACPIIASQVAGGLDRLTPEQRGQVVAIAISTHPDDDTPANVRAFLRKQGAEGSLRYLIGSERELRPVWERFDVLSALDSGDADTHSASVHVYDASGEWVSTLHPAVDLTPANVAHDVVMAAGGAA